MEIHKGRIGQFFLFIGLLLLVIFFLSDQPEGPLVNFFCTGLLVTGFGLYLIWRDWKPPQPTQRFRMVRQMRDRPKGKDRNEKNDQRK